MATFEQCQAALARFAAQLAADASKGKKVSIDRTFSCSITDLGAIFTGRLLNGTLLDLHVAQEAKAQVRLSMPSDDLIALVDGDLKLPAAWAAGRVKISASPLDLIKLKSLF